MTTSTTCPGLAAARPTVGPVLLACLACVLWGAHARAQESDAPLDVLSTDELAQKRAREAPPVLTCSPAELRATATERRPVSLTLDVANTGGGSLSWRVSSAPAWARVTPRGGTLGWRGKEAVTVSLDPSGAGSGMRTGALVVEATGVSESPARIVLSLRVPQLDERGMRPAAAPPGGATSRRPATPRSDRPSGERDRGLAVRVAMVLPASGERDYDASPLVGLRYAGGGGESRFRYELGVEFGPAEEAGGFESSQVGLSADALFRLGRMPASGAYALAGLEGFVESVQSQTTGNDYTNYAAALGFGAGWAFAGGRADVRAAYQVILGSENLDGQTVVSAGLRF